MRRIAGRPGTKPLRWNAGWRRRATPEEAAEAQAQFEKRADASPDGELWTCGVPDEDDA
jgi:hypothetical protein